MAYSVFLKDGSVMVGRGVKMALMNLNPSAHLHVQVICLLVLMAQNAFPSQEFAMGGL